MFEVDLEYPEAIHDLTKWLPLAPENKPITLGMYTKHMRELLEERNSDRGLKASYLPPTETKLLGTCWENYNYVVHFKVLKFYLEMGMKI